MFETLQAMGITMCLVKVTLDSLRAMLGGEVSHNLLC
jgi:hypothetical protein